MSEKPRRKPKICISKENILEAALKKKVCNARALQIVVSLLEPTILAEDFLSKLQHINQGHYDDVVEERHIQGLCGYPLCAQIVKDVPTQKYHIDAKVYKVFDITERKKFCSGQCFKASEYIKQQISTSPLWLRQEEETSEFKLYEVVR